MFDDNNVPNNLPIKEDKLGNTKKEEVKKNSLPKQDKVNDLPKVKPMPQAAPPPDVKTAEDIFADVKESVPVSVGVKSDISSSALKENIHPKAEMTTPVQGFKKILVTIITIIVVAGVLTFLGYLVYNYFTNRTNNTELKLPITEPVQKTQPASQPTPQPAPQPKSVNLDKDNDGLLDSEELKLGTNPLNPDTDGDGLFDKEEVDFYKTDPLNPDTDGDGYIDGSEVQNGYDPRGAGKLIQIPAEQQ